MFAQKFGLQDTDAALILYKKLGDILEGVDYTIFFRELCKFKRSHTEADDDTVLQIISPAFYEDGCRDKWLPWLRQYLSFINKQEVSDEDRQRQMRAVNPKYVPREWMLVEAYRTAEALDFTLVRELLQVFQNPYDEQPQFEERYYRKTPDQYQNKGGVTFMT